MGGKRKLMPQGLRFNVLRRDEFRCTYCGRESPEVVLHVDHVKAAALGGTDDMGNLTTSCSECNQGKGVKDVDVSPRERGSLDGLIGMYGHSLDADGKIHWQFKVIRSVGNDAYAVQLFSWICGAPTDVKIIDTEVLRSSTCRLYGTRQAWMAAADLATDWVERRAHLPDLLPIARSAA
ncbi:MAG: HNH endonuclease [Ferrovibrio sp.]|uniref:HNH endonuclease n=1 Tax=Ferrovibrio sp. TaxID=1917215 RepID=UPI002615487A|nr:HNH endonuclease [Ferrovibrio sp.]MCW0235261.1 HNH endonuclease [Ferrovibrio sp.]